MSQQQLPEPAPLGWYLKHHDDVQHGPFAWDKIVAGAKNNRLHASTEIMHPERTGGQWIQVSRLDGLAGFLQQIPTPPAGGAPSTSPATPQIATPQVTAAPVRVRATKRKKSSGLVPWLTSTLLFLAPTTAVMGLVVYRVGPDKVMAMLGQAKPQVKNNSEPKKTPLTGSSSQKPAAKPKPRPATSRTTGVESDSSSTGERTKSPTADLMGADGEPVDTANNRMTDAEKKERRERLEEFARMGRGETTVAATPKPQGLTRGEDYAIPLNLQRDKFSVEIPAETWSQTNPSEPKFIVEGIERVIGQITANPSSRLLTTSTPVRMTVSTMPTFGMEIKLLPAKSTGSPSHISINMKFRPVSQEPVGFTLDRIERSVRFVAKNLQASQLQRNQMVAERTSRQTYVKSRQIKPLDMVNAAKNRISVLDQQIVAAKNILAGQQTTLTQLNELGKIAQAIAEGPGLMLVPLKND